MEIYWDLQGAGVEFRVVLVYFWALSMFGRWRVVPLRLTVLAAYKPFDAWLGYKFVEPPVDLYKRLLYRPPALHKKLPVGGGKIHLAQQIESHCNVDKHLDQTLSNLHLHAKHRTMLEFMIWHHSLRFIIIHTSHIR